VPAGAHPARSAGAQPLVGARFCAAAVQAHPPAFCLTATATTELYTLSLHDALPTWPRDWSSSPSSSRSGTAPPPGCCTAPTPARSEEHTSELQSRENLVCRPLLEKKNGCAEPATATFRTSSSGAVALSVAGPLPPPP